MKRALTAALIAGVLAAHAQTPPESPPPTPSPTESAPAPPAETPVPEGEPPAAQPLPPAKTPAAVSPGEPPAKTPAAVSPGEPPAPAAKAPAVKPPPPRPPALTTPEPGRDSEVASLRREVARLQSELDAERAAAVPPAEEAGPGLPPGSTAWGWLVVVALLGLAGGFVLGWRLLDRRIRRKYGGLRIY